MLETSTTLRRLLLAIILTTGLVLRLVGLGFGLPIISNGLIRPDEMLHAVTAFASVSDQGGALLTGQSALFSLLCSILFRVRFVIRSVFGPIEAVDWMDDFAVDPSGYFFLGRLLSALLGVATVFVVYRLGRRMAGATVGLTAAALFAVAPLAVREAHALIPDTLFVFLLAGLVLALFDYLLCTAEDERGRVSAAAVWLGLAVATHVTALLVLPAVLLAMSLKMFVHAPRRVFAAVFIFALISFVTWLLVNMAAGIDHRNFGIVCASAWEQLFERPAGSPVWTFPDGLVRLYGMLRFGPGETAGLALALFGLVWRPWRSWGSGMLVVGLVAILPFLMALLAANAAPLRQALPIMPLLAVFAAVGVIRLGRGLAPGGKQIAVTLALAVLLLPGLARSVCLDRLLARADTRTLAGEWIMANMKTSEPVVFLCSPEAEPQLTEDRDSIEQRILYLKRLSRHRTGGAVIGFHELQRSSRSSAAPNRFRVSRNPMEVEYAPRLAVVAEVRVTPWNKGRVAGVEDAVNLLPGKRVLETVSFRALKQGAPEPEYDNEDFFFLPMTGLENIERPGPDLYVILLADPESKSNDAQPAGGRQLDANQAL